MVAPLLPGGDLYGVFIVSYFVDTFAPIIDNCTAANRLSSEEERYHYPVIKNSPRSGSSVWKHFAA